MKKSKLLLACAIMSTFGCTTMPPSPELIETSSYGIGASTALVVKLLNVDETTSAAISDILARVRKIVPEKDETFEAAWTPTISEYISKLQATGKIDSTKAKLLTSAMRSICKGVDRLFEKYPEWAEYGDLTDKAVDGFINGFNTVMAYEKSAAGECADQDEVEIICSRSGVVYRAIK